MNAHSLSDIDPRLLSEAFRRARETKGNAELDADALFSAILDAARAGARDLYSLVKAANAVRPTQAAAA
jgi:hypothetical protein